MSESAEDVFGSNGDVAEQGSCSIDSGSEHDNEDEQRDGGQEERDNEGDHTESEDQEEDGGEEEGEGMDNEGEHCQSQELNGNEAMDTNGDPLEDIDLWSMTPAEFRELKFQSPECACVFYNEYGRINGFGIRKSKVGRNKQKKITWVRFICNRAGYREEKYVERGGRQRQHRPLTRCGCEAQLRVRVDNASSLWYIGRFSDDHNHQVVSLKCMELARSHQNMSDADIAQLNMMRKSGISTPHIFGSFVVQCGGIDKLRFRRRKVYNQIVKQRAMFECDLNEALKHLGDLQSVDPELYFKYLVHDDGTFMYLFWCDGCSRLDYQLFGDVLAFDATYGKNKYKLPLIIFSGVNHHKQTCVFASAIVANETEEMYMLVLQHFVQAMRGKCPATVITDGDLAIRNAICKVFPAADHRLCAWHLLRNATANICKPYFTKQFKKCMLGDFEVAEFEERWRKLIEECGLQDNQWVAELYGKKTMWASAHIRGKFFAGLRTTSRCEGLHAIIGRYVKKGYNLVEFLEQYDRCVENMRNNEVEADYRSQNTEPVLQTEFQKLEKFGSEVYTREIFDVFRCVLVKTATIRVVEVIESPSALIYVLCKYCTPNMRWHVSYYRQLDEFRCSCRRMESIGIPCSHIIKVVIELDMEELPATLLLPRWTKGIKEGLWDNFGEAGARVDGTVNLMRCGGLVHLAREVCKLACYSTEDWVQIREQLQKEKERLKQKHGHRVNIDDVEEPHIAGVVFKRRGGAQDGSSCKTKRKPQVCSVCHNKGHNRSTCPEVVRQVNNSTGIVGSSLAAVRESDEECGSPVTGGNHNEV